MQQKIPVLLWYVLTAVLLAVVWWFFSWRYPSIVAEFPSLNCHIEEQSCLSQFEGAELRVSLQPTSVDGEIYSLQTIPVTVQLTGLEASKVEIDLEGISEYMGLIRQTLTHSGSEVDGGTFNGELFIPTCVQQTMQWRASVLIHTSQGIYRSVYLFDSLQSSEANNEAQ